MSRKRLIRRGIAGAAALVVASALTVGVTASPALASVGPDCPGNGSSLQMTKVYPASTDNYRGVILCDGSWGGDHFFVQILALDKGASMRVVSHPTTGSNPLGLSDTKFDRLYVEQWRTGMASYNTIPGTGDLYSTVNAGFFKSSTTATTALSFPELKTKEITSMGWAYRNEPGDKDYTDSKVALKIGYPPGSTQAVRIDSFPSPYTVPDVHMPVAPTGTDTYDGVVGRGPFVGDPALPSRRTFVGTSNDNRTVYILTTINDFLLQQTVDLFAAMGVSQSHLVQLDGGGSTQLSTRSGSQITSASGDCGTLPCKRAIPEVLAVYEGNPPVADNGLAVGDLNSDGRGDILGRRANGDLMRFMNSGNNGNPFPGSGNFIGPSWNQWKWWLSDRVDGDYYADIVACRFDGTLWLYKNTGNTNTPYGNGTQIGYGWGIYSNAALGNLNPEDGRADIIAAKPDGTLWRYINTMNDNAPFNTPTQIGSGWQAYNRIKLGDLNRDLLDDIVATKPDGTLVVNTNTMTSKTSGFSIYQPKAIGSGWQNIDRFAVADVTGDAFDDIVATKPDGTLWRYTNNYPAFFSYNGAPITSDIFTAPTLVGQGWQSYN